MIEPVQPDQLIEEYASSVYRTCRRHLSNDELAWDAFQDTFLAYCRRKDTLDLQSDLGPWLNETARRCSLTVVRKQKRQPANESADLETLSASACDSPLESVSLAEAGRVLRHELSRLTKEDQEVLHCIYVEGMTHREVAGRLNCPQGSVCARADQARSRLRQKLERRGIIASALLLLFLLQGNAQASEAAAVVQPVARRRFSPLLWTTLALMTLVLVSTAIAVDIGWTEQTANGVNIGEAQDESLSENGLSCSVPE